MPKSVAISLAVLSLIASACTRSVVAEVQVFHDLDDRAGGETIVILPADDRNRDSLEFDAYSRLLAEHLRAHGFVVTSKPSRADLVAFLDYGVDGGQAFSRTYSSPIWGTTGVSTTPDGYVTSTYGIKGYTTRTKTGVLYNRFVSIDIVAVDSDDDGRRRSLYEARIISSGSCASMAEVIDEILAAGFTEFPGPSGRGRQVAISTPSTC